VAGVIGWAGLAGLAACGHPPAEVPVSADGVPGVTGTVVSIADGDTLTVTLGDGTKAKVRLLGIDAPEVAHSGGTAECGGDAAAARLGELAPVGSAVTLVADTAAADQDRYGRWLRYIVTPTTADVGLTLIEEGLVEAWIPSRQPEPDRWADYTAATDRAAAAGTGSWATCETLGR
jgi:endonuclease YncB( thermonuclease family)